MDVQRTASPEKPRIPDLNERKELDLDQLGDKPLFAYLKYTGMQEGDLLRPRWVGASPVGQAFDDIGAVRAVEREDLESGAVISIGNANIRKAAGGWAFLSYTLNDAQESLRQFCYLGLRLAPTPESLSVLHAVQSHDLIIRPGDLPSDGLSLLVSPYQAMQIGDKITLSVVGYDEDDVEDDEWTRVLTVGNEHLDKMPLSASVPKNFFRWLEKGYVQAFYSIAFVDGSTLDSPVQRLTVDSTATLPDLLGKLEIDGHEEGTPLDPAKFRNGLTIRVPAYPGMAVSDHIVMHWRSPAGELFRTLRVDPSIIEAKSILFRVAADFLMLNGGLQANLSYLYSREGASLSSEVLPLDVIKSRNLVAPNVSGALADSTPNWGSMSALDAVGGVYVVVPADTVVPGERVELHWQGQSELGRYIAKEPVSAQNPLRFFIPAQYVPANLGRGEKDESRRFEVFYRLLDAADDYVDSVAYQLRIKPFASTAFPQITCDQASSGTLSLSQVPAAGADLTLGTWYFGAAGQLLTLSVSSVTVNGTVEDVIRDSVPVSASEASNGVKAKLPKSLLEGMTINESFTLSARLSYDGGRYYTPFRSSRVQLIR